MKSVYAKDAPAVVGPYSQAIIANGLIFCSGQIGLDPKTGILSEGLEAQTHQVMKNLQAVLQAAGSDLDQVVKTTIYLMDMGSFAKVNAIYETYFTKTKPARATIEVSKLPKEALIEVEAIGVQ